MGGLGRKRWAIADGYIPAWSTGTREELQSHESISLLNPSDADASIRLTVFFSDREPAGPYQVGVMARRTKHVRLDQLDQPEPIPRGTEYSVLIESDVPVIVQHTRLDSRQAENAIFSTLAYPVE